MSRRYLEKQSGTGYSTKKVASKFGSKIMEKFGWSEGQGLGKSKTGMTECIQVRRREDNLGLGANNNNNFDWKNPWWEKSYQSILDNIKINIKKGEDDEEENEGVRSSISTISESETEVKNEKNDFVHKKREREKNKKKGKKLRLVEL